MLPNILLQIAIGRPSPDCYLKIGEFKGASFFSRKSPPPSFKRQGVAQPPAHLWRNQTIAKEAVRMIQSD
jgi:hypothetical protein